MRIATLTLLLAFGCGRFGYEASPQDANPGDAATPSDAAPAIDAATDVDAALPDAALPDAALPDAALPDAALPDATPADAGPSPETCNGIDDDFNGIIDDGDVCPCPVTQFGGHAYMFCTAGTDWASARDACAASGYYLATINTNAENSFLTGQISAMTWTGLNDMATEGTFVWVENDNPFGFESWASGQPDGGNSTEDCVMLDVDSLWYDRLCATVFDYVCEAP